MTAPTPGRVGITYEQVAAAADAIAARGERPTLRGVRNEMGTGSLGTIQKHLSAWQSQRRQIVISTATLPTEIQRIILEEIEREVSSARLELETELSETKADRDTLADDNEMQAALIEQQASRLDEIEATSQQQTGRIAQLESDIETAWQATERERGIAEQARQALAKAELRLEVLPKVEAEVERLRAALENTHARATAAEQQAAVTAEKLAGVEARLADTLAREKQALADTLAKEENAAAKLKELEKNAKDVAAQADEFRYRMMDADNKARLMEREIKVLNTRAATAEQKSLVAEERASELEKRALAAENSVAELKGMLHAFEKINKDRREGKEQ